MGTYTINEGFYIQTDIKYLIIDENDIKHWDTVSQSYVKVSELPMTAENMEVLL